MMACVSISALQLELQCVHTEDAPTLPARVAHESSRSPLFSLTFTCAQSAPEFLRDRWCFVPQFPIIPTRKQPDARCRNGPSSAIHRLQKAASRAAVGGAEVEALVALHLPFTALE